MLRAFMAVTAHYINSEGELAEHLVAFRRIHGHHTGANVGQVLFSILEDIGITHKVSNLALLSFVCFQPISGYSVKLGHITLDNASNNNTLMQELEEVFVTRGVLFERQSNRIRYVLHILAARLVLIPLNSCFPHVINLAVQAILDALPFSAQSFRSAAQADKKTLDKTTLDYLMALESEPVDICRDSVRAMRVNDIRREGLQEAIRDGNFSDRFKTSLGEILVVPLLQLLRDCATRWSSTYFMILRYLQLYPVRMQKFCIE